MALEQRRAIALRRSATWQAVNDGVTGGVSDGRFRVTDRQTLEGHGTLSLENTAGSASVRSPALEPGIPVVESRVYQYVGQKPKASAA